jgi:hypothetical protein
MDTPSLRLAAVEAAPGLVLVAMWQDGRVDRVNLSGWIESAVPYFHRLRDPAVFARAAVTDYGLTVEWAGDENLAIDTRHLAKLAEQQAPFGPDEAAAWQAAHGVSNQEVGDLLGITANTWLNYKNGSTRIPGAVAIACRAMDADQVIFNARYRPRRNGRPPVAA